MSGWYPDPTGRFEYRWHNGQEWTADVSRDGTRYIDPPTSTPTPTAGQQGNGLAVAGMVCGIAALTVGWIPILAVAGLPLAVVAIALAAVGLGRARRGRTGHGFAVTGLITGGLGVLASAVGIVLTVLFVVAIDRFLEPGPHAAAVSTCTADGPRVTVGGSVTNLGEDRQTYTVEVLVRRGTDHASEHVTVDDVPPGADGTFRTVIVTNRSVGDVTCDVGEVNGPLPFGLDADLFDS